MNKEIRDFFDDKGIIVKKITINGGVIIVDTGAKKYVIKKRNIKNLDLFKYLASRGFNNYPKILFNTDNYDVFDYIYSVDIPNEERATDIIKLVSKLHSKTTFYKDIDDDYYKNIYEDFIDNINYLFNYYDDYVNIIDNDIYMSPSNYYFVRNISLVFKALNYCRNYINRWYDIIKNKKRIRVVNLHNNLSLDHYLVSDNQYFISWDKSIKDMPIFDLVVFYKRYYNVFDFVDLINLYVLYFPLLEEEKYLLFCFMIIPSKLEFNSCEFDMCSIVNSFYDYIDNSLKIVNELDNVEK